MPPCLRILPLLLPTLLGATFFTSNFPEMTSRPWPGPEYFANRMLDWQVNAGRLECVTGQGKPMRTVHRLTHYAGGAPGILETEVLTGATQTTPHAKPSPNTWTGFLIGVGGEHVDFRISALCHHWPAQDGGLIVAIDGTGRVVVRSNTAKQKISDTSQPDKAFPKLPGKSSEGPAFTGRMPERVRLHLKAAPNATGTSYNLTATATNPADGAIIHQFIAPNINASLIDGNLALVSHNSPGQTARGYWFKDWSASGTKLREDASRALGPVFAAQYTLSRNILKLTAQLPALGKQDTQTAELHIRTGQGARWNKVATGTLQEHSFTIPFRVEGWDATQAHAYRIVYEVRTGEGQSDTHHFEGTIRKDPAKDPHIKLAAFTGHHISAQGAGNWNHGSIWYPHNELTRAITWHDPDLLFFSGDQIYEGGLAGIIREPADLACVDYLYHWVRWCWAFRDLARDRPTLCLPDDHDVYHGNIWGSGGKKAVRTEGVGGNAADSGGYQMAPLFVNAVHRTQVSHLPDPAHPEPIQQGISTYHTAMEYGGLSFGILADRMWKSSPSVVIKDGNVVNGWFHNEDFDPLDADVPGATLLGAKQLTFLEDWAADWSHPDTQMKVLLSQTLFNNVSTLPKGALNDKVVPRMPYPQPGEYPEDALSSDCDSNGWPQSGRNAAIRAFRKCLPFHIAGDQHLASFIQYGVEHWNDSPHAFCVPSIANVWPRRWFPPQPGRNRKFNAPKYTGNHVDGFGNKMTVHAVANPVLSGHKPAALYDRMPGYGIVTFDKEHRQATFECWPRWEDPAAEDAKQFEGWPITVRQRDNLKFPEQAHLPTIIMKNATNPVLQVVAEQDGTVLYTLRIKGDFHTPAIPGTPGATFTVIATDSASQRKGVLKGLKAAGPNKKRIVQLE